MFFSLVNDYLQVKLRVGNENVTELYPCLHLCMKIILDWSCRSKSDLHLEKKNARNGEDAVSSFKNFSPTLKNKAAMHINIGLHT